MYQTKMSEDLTKTSYQTQDAASGAGAARMKALGMDLQGLYRDKKKQ